MPEGSTSQKSELERLLERNAYTEKGLTPEEAERAIVLIKNPEYSGKNCWVCEMVNRGNQNFQVDPAIYDTGLCQSHAIYALATRK